MKCSNNPKKFLSQEELSRVTAKIAGAEKLTSAEIKLVIVRHCWIDIWKKAQQTLKKYNLDKTQDRNCVLILLVTTNRQFLIYGDQGIHEKVGHGFWDDVKNHMVEQFKKDQFGRGLCTGIHLIGQSLAAISPNKEMEANEISDNVEFED
jgi:uncharacterized membrane protein